MRTVIVGVRAAVLMAAGVIRAGTAAGQIYFHDATVEVAATGSAPACTVRFIPTMTLGGGLAPRLVLIAKGPSRLAFGVEDPERYSDVVIVQHNTRTPLTGAGNAGVDQFHASDLAAALKSRSLFFITARRDGGYVSSRYEGIDLEAILAKMEACRSGSRPGDRPAAPAAAASTLNGWPRPTLWPGAGLSPWPAAPAAGHFAAAAPAAAASADVRRFDGSWSATLTCDSTPSGLLGWRYEFSGRFDQGVFHAVHGAVSANPAMQVSEAHAYDGRVGPDGAMTIWEKTIAGQNDLFGRRRGAVFQSTYTGRLDRFRGLANRHDLPCHLSLSRATK